jgi:hypothetical protein
MFRVDRKRGRAAESSQDDSSYNTRAGGTGKSMLHLHGDDGAATPLGVGMPGNTQSKLSKPTTATAAMAAQAFTAEEDIRLVEEVLTHGLRFTMLSRLHNPSRSPDALRRRWSVLQLVLLHAAPTLTAASSDGDLPSAPSSEAWKNAIYQWHIQNALPGSRGLAGGRGHSSVAMLAAQRVSDVVRGREPSTTSGTSPSVAAGSSVASSAARETRSLSGMHPTLYEPTSAVFRHQPTILNPSLNLRSRSPTLRLPMEGTATRRTNSPTSTWSGITASARSSPSTASIASSTTSAARTAHTGIAKSTQQESMPWFIESEAGVPACAGSYHPVAARNMETLRMSNCPPPPPAGPSREVLTDSPLPEMVAERAIRMIEEEAVQRFIDDLVEQTVAHGTVVTKATHADPAPSSEEERLLADSRRAPQLSSNQTSIRAAQDKETRPLGAARATAPIDARVRQFVPEPQVGSLAIGTVLVKESESFLPCENDIMMLQNERLNPADTSGDALKQLKEAAQAVVVESNRPQPQLLQEPLTGLEPLLSVMEQVERTVHQQSSPSASPPSTAHARPVDFAQVGHLPAHGSTRQGAWGADQVQAAITANIHTQMYLQQATINHPPGNISLNSPPSEQQRALQEQGAMSRAGTATAVMAAWLGGSAAVTGWGFSTPLWSNVFEQPRCLWKSAVPRVLAYCLPLPCLYHVHLENFCPKRWFSAGGLGGACGAAASQTCAGSPTTSSLLTKPTANLPGSSPGTVGVSSAINTSGVSQTYGTFCHTDSFIQDPFRSKSPMRPRPHAQSRMNLGEATSLAGGAAGIPSVLDSFTSGIRECELLAEIVAAANQRSREVAQVMIWF